MNTIAWVDIETTGLDARTDEILEVGVIITDDKLNEIRRASWVAHKDALADFSSASDFVQRMHRESGLVDDVLRSGWQSRDQMVHALWEFLRAHAADGAKHVPAGNNVLSFDFSFLRHNACVDFEDAIGHRALDVSSLWEGLRIGFGIERPKMPPAHRALADCEMLIALYRAWLDAVREIEK